MQNADRKETRTSHGVPPAYLNKLQRGTKQCCIARILHYYINPTTRHSNTSSQLEKLCNLQRMLLSIIPLDFLFFIEHLSRAWHPMISLAFPMPDCDAVSQVRLSQVAAAFIWGHTPEVETGT